MKKYVLKYPNGNYVAIDRNSGGYPYGVKDYCEAYKFFKKEKAKEYAQKFSELFELHIVKEEKVLTEKIDF